MKYKFDGYDRVEDENGNLYRDGLDKRSGPIIVDLLDEREQLQETITSLLVMLDSRNRALIALNAEWAIDDQTKPKKTGDYPDRTDR